MLMRQFELNCKDGTEMVVWLEDDPRLRVGAKLTLEETGDRFWFVTWRGMLTADKQALHKPWRVGGLV